MDLSYSLGVAIAQRQEPYLHGEQPLSVHVLVHCSKSTVCVVTYITRTAKGNVHAEPLRAGSLCCNMISMWALFSHCGILYSEKGSTFDSSEKGRRSRAGWPWSPTDGTSAATVPVTSHWIDEEVGKTRGRWRYLQG